MAEATKKSVPEALFVTACLNSKSIKGVVEFIEAAEGEFATQWS